MWMGVRRGAENVFQKNEKQKKACQPSPLPDLFDISTKQTCFPALILL